MKIPAGFVFWQEYCAWFDKLTMREAGDCSPPSPLMVSLSNHAPQLCPTFQQPDATAGVATARSIRNNYCAAMAASIRRTASSLSHGAGPFMAAIWQPSLSTIIVTGRPNARFLRLSSLNTPMVGSR